MKEHSAILLGGIQYGSLGRCPHCGGHFLIAAKGHLSDARKVMGNAAHPRVFCQKCGRLTCGRPQCDPILACIPMEAQLEHSEGKRTKYDDLIIDVKYNRGLPIL
jgi:nitrite reductase/ring-hydroxylating ferredoxin subunit